jgi:hypothetical protein
MLKVITRKDKNNLGFKIVGDINMDDIENEYKKVYDKLWRKVHGIICNDLSGLKEVRQEEDLYDIDVEQDCAPRFIITLSCTARREFSWKCTYKMHFYVLLNNMVLFNNMRYPMCTKDIDDANSPTEVITYLRRFCSFMN